MRRDLFWALAFLALPFALAACSSSPSRTPEQIAKSCEAAAKVESAFIAEVLAACDGYESAETCPAFPPIDARYKPLREQAVKECKQ